MTKQWIVRVALSALSVAIYGPYVMSAGGQSPAASQQRPSAVGRGQSATRLSDGQWLLVGGEGIERMAVVWNPQTGTAAPTTSALQTPRAWHSATVLSDGRVLIAGGRYDGGLIETPEIFDPTTGVFTPFAIGGAVPRALHTGTLLTDGRVLVAGGSDGGPLAPTTEIWDVTAQTVTPLPLADVGRSAHSATLLADGRVLLTGGRNPEGTPAAGSDIVDPRTLTLVHVETPTLEGMLPVVAESAPVNGATMVPLDAHLTLRFSDALVVDTITAQTLTLRGPDGPVSTKVIAAEQGRLAFVWPTDALAEETPYVLTVAGLANATGMPLLPASITFTTVSHTTAPVEGADAEAWIPTADSIRTGWRTGRPPSSWESLAPLLGPSGATAISGRVLTLDGRPLPNVTLAVKGEVTVRSDRTGRFLLLIKSAATARRVLQIEGQTASHPGRAYGFFEYGLTVVAAQTNVLPFTIWMPKLDTQHTVTIPSPTTREVVVTTPYIPGLELHIPPNAILTGVDGKPVTQVSITPVPVDRPPFPLPTNFTVPVYFTLQPGGAWVWTVGTGAKGAWLVYPNYRHDPPGERVQFYHYDPTVLGWYVYGMGTVTATGAQVSPDATTRLYAFTGAMFNDGTPTPAAAPPPGCDPRADPVDPSTGIFVMSKTDLYLPDVIPLALTRTYDSGDGYSRPFGRSMTHPYAMFLHSEQQYQQVDLIVPTGGKVHFVRTSSGTGYLDAVFVHQETATTSATPTTFYKSVITWNGQGWNLTLTDGTVYVFGEVAPLQAIRDRYGNTVTITHASGQTGNVTQVTSPNGRWISFTYNASDQITQATDNIGRVVAYTYDASGNLATVTDPENGVTTYTYDASNLLATIKDGRNIVYLTNQYVNGRVSSQTQADPSSATTFSYTLDGSGNVTQTDITDPRGHVERLTFNANHYIVTDVQALGAPEARTTTATRQAGSNLVTAITDGLSRRTEYAYDGSGRVLTVTRLAGTSDAVTTTFTYEPQFGQLATLTDPMNHTWTMGYDSLGRITSATDPLTHQTMIGMNTLGQVTSTTDPLQHTAQFGYTGGDLTSLTNSVNAVQRRFVDAAGRVIAVTDPLGRQTRMLSDKLNRVTAVTDPLGGQTSFAYDPNSNLLTLTDALSHATTYGYDASDRVATRTDPVQRMTSYQYDQNSNLTQVTDRKGKVTGSQYDALDRRTQVTFADTSTIASTYDAGDRITQIVDSTNGTTTRTYDNFNRLTQETTAQGTVNYTYDADSRRATMTVSGQTVVSYAYDDAHRLTSITQGASVVSLTYDDANRRTTLTYPNGIVATSWYDSANRLTSLNYALGGATLGDLTYTYDAAGNRTSVGGSWARTGIPQAVPPATFDAANRITTRGGTTFSYDLNGNLTSNGTTTYTWNVRNQLAAVSGGVTASFQYDAVGRRRGKTVGTTSTNFLYDGLNLLQELSGTTPTANLLTGLGLDETFTRTDAGGTRSPLVDALGSTLELADASGTLQTHYTFEPFGATTVSGATTTNTAQFTDRENDGTGLQYNRARYYDPISGRFISEDPLGFAAGVNFYSYVRDNPINLVDPSGLCPDTSSPSQDCLNALATAGANTDALTRATDNWSAIQSAAAANGIDPNLLAAIAIRESGFQNIAQIGGGQGAGVFQIDLGQNPTVAPAQAYDPTFAANFAGSMLATNSATLARQHPNLNPTQLLQATAASYNFGTGNISGNSNTIDVGSTGGNYGSNVLGLMACFQ
jgi:RHS repeat-associated protein